MRLSDLLVQEFDVENRYTRKTLERVPLEKGAWKPHDKSMTLGWLATFLALAPGWVKPLIELDRFDPSGPDKPSGDVKVATTTHELLELFDRTTAEARKAIAGASDEHLMEPWTLAMGGKEMFTQPRWLALRTYLLNHNVHHRAQLGVYLRLSGVAVPAIYNDSADEKGGMFRDDDEAGSEVGSEAGSEVAAKTGRTGA
jgi:uncharacterized damage-inducible protein DinB